MALKWWGFKLNKKKNCLSSTRGSAAIEFAIIAPAFLLLFMAIFEIGAIMLVKSSLELSVLQVSRFGRTGSVVAGETSQQTATSLATQYSFGLVDPAKLILTVTPYASFSAIPPLAQAPSTGVQNFGTGNQAVLYTLSYNWNFFTPFLVGKLLSKNGTSINLQASAVVMNEPF